MVIRLALALRQDDGLVRDLPAGNLAQQMVNAVQSGAFLVDGFDHPPRRLRDVGAFEHLFFRFGVHLPAAA